MYLLCEMDGCSSTCMQQWAELNSTFDTQQLWSAQGLSMTDRLWGAEGLSLAWRGFANLKSS